MFPYPMFPQSNVPSLHISQNCLAFLQHCVSTAVCQCMLREHWAEGK